MKFEGNYVHVCLNPKKNLYADIPANALNLGNNCTVQDLLDNNKKQNENIEILENKINELVNKYNTLLQAYKTNNVLTKLQLQELENGK